MSTKASSRHRRRRSAVSAIPSAGPSPARYTIVGAASAGTIGAIAGLIIGLLAYPPTALFAVFELGVPATVAGGVIGFVAALIVAAGRSITRAARRFLMRTG
jgi:galactitol-specific phosphotransferase system IIC component